MSDPWEKQGDESAPAFAAFAVYRDLGPGRSITKVVQQVHKSRALLGRWSRTHSWVMRAAAFDREQDRQFQVEVQQARRDVARRHARVAQAVMGKAVARLQGLDVRELSPADLLRYLQVAAEIERRALESAPVVDAGGDPNGAADAVVLTDEERRTRMDHLRRELQRRLGSPKEER